MPTLRRKSSSHVAVSGFRRILYPFKIFSLNQAFDSPLDHGDIRQEAGRQLMDDFCDEIRVIELFPLPDEVKVSLTTNSRKILSN